MDWNTLFLQFRHAHVFSNDGLTVNSNNAFQWILENYTQISFTHSNQ